MNEQAEHIGTRVDKLFTVSAEMKLNNMDSITVTDMLSLLRSRYTRILNTIKEHRTQLGKLLDRFKDIYKKIEDTNVLMKKIEDYLKELNVPLGRNVEDVYERTAAYQVRVPVNMDVTCN